MLKNKAIEPHWQNFQRGSTQEVPEELAEIIRSNFVEVFGALVPECLIGPNERESINKRRGFHLLPEQRRNVVQDRTGLECSLSKIHIDGIVDSNHFEIAILFLKQLFQEFNKQHPTKVLRGIVTLDDNPENSFSCCVRFHVKRPHEWWIDEDVKNYSEGVFVLDSIELPLIGQE